MKSKIFQLSWKKVWAAVIIGFLGVVIHNLIYSVFNFEEGVFFFVPFLVVLYLIVAGINSLIKKLN